MERTPLQVPSRIPASLVQTAHLYSVSPLRVLIPRMDAARTPLVWSAASVDGKIEGWNVERGVATDFVLGANYALEEEGYVPFFENHFYKSGAFHVPSARLREPVRHSHLFCSEFTTWWGVDDKFGPILVSMLKYVGPLSPMVTKSIHLPTVFSRISLPRRRPMEQLRQMSLKPIF